MAIWYKLTEHLPTCRIQVELNDGSKQLADYDFYGISNLAGEHIDDRTIRCWSPVRVGAAERVEAT